MVQEGNEQGVVVSVLGMAAGGTGFGKNREQWKLPQTDTVLWDMGRAHFRQEVHIEYNGMCSDQKQAGTEE